MSLGTAFKRPESVLVVIYDQHGRVLLLQRKDDPAFWQSVTGSLEEQELPYQTALREVQEETGVSLLSTDYHLQDHQHINDYLIRPQWRYRYPPAVVTNKEHVFSVCWRGNESIVLTEHLSYQWLSRSEAIRRVWSDSNRDAIERFVAKVDDTPEE